MRRFGKAVAAMLAAGAVAGAAPAPRVSIARFDQLAQPLPFPYDERSDAAADVAAAHRRAQARHVRLLIDLGGNWCPDCRILAGVMRLPEVARSSHGTTRWWRSTSAGWTATRRSPHTTA